MSFLQFSREPTFERHVHLAPNRRKQTETGRHYLDLSNEKLLFLFSVAMVLANEQDPVETDKRSAGSTLKMCDSTQLLRFLIGVVLSVEGW